MRFPKQPTPRFGGGARTPEGGRDDKGEREAYYRHLDNIVILRNNIYTERAEGRAEGRMEGRAEGEHAKALEIARRLKAMGLSVDAIIGATGLSAEEIEKA